MKPSEHQTPPWRWFVVSAALILSVTGLGKLLSILGEAPALGRADGLFYFLSNRQLLFIAAILELAVAVYLITDQSISATLCLAWLATMFIVYRIGLNVIGASTPCSCLGVFTNALGLGSKNAEWLVKGVLLYLLIGSLVVLFRKNGRAEGEWHMKYDSRS